MDTGTLIDDLFLRARLLVPFTGLFITALALTGRLSLQENENEGVSGNESTEQERRHPEG